MTPLATGASDARLIILDPGHFHAALIQKDMYPWLSPRVSVYAPLAPELVDYVNRITLYNSRADNPTRWELDVHAGPDFFARMLADKPGNVVVLSGRNRSKIDRILASLGSGYHVFADKPWIITAADLPKLAASLELARERKLAAYDIMTERFEVTSLVQRALVNDPAVFGKIVEGSEAKPAVKARSVHHLMKLVSGVPLRRPAWFFDIDEYGEALADVGTHVVDLVQWTVFPDQVLDWLKDVRMISGRHWPTNLTLEQYKQVTGEAAFAPALAPHVKNNTLEYVSNNSVSYAVKGVHVALDILWNWEAPAGEGDVYEASFQGTRARVELRGSDVWIVPAGDPQALWEPLRASIARMGRDFPGLAVEQKGTEARILIPAALRVGHEAHFAQVANRFFDYVRNPAAMPAWERANMLVKYFITTRGVELAQPAR